MKPEYTSDAARYAAQYNDLLKRYEELEREHLNLLTDYNKLVSDVVVAYESIKFGDPK